MGQPTLEFTPASGAMPLSAQKSVKVTVSLKVQGLPIVLPASHKEYNLDVKATQYQSVFFSKFGLFGKSVVISVSLLQSQGLSWEIVAHLLPIGGQESYDANKLTIWCSMAGIKPSEVSYTINTASVRKQAKKFNTASIILACHCYLCRLSCSNIDSHIRALFVCVLCM